MQFLQESTFINTALIYLHQTKIRSQVIYTATLLATLGTILVLPFIYTTVSVKGTGSLQSNIEKTELLAPINGRIMQLNLKDNQKTEKGEVLMSIDASLPLQQNSAIQSKSRQLSLQIEDASMLLKFTGEHNFSQQLPLKTGLYLASWQQYLEQTRNTLNAREQAFKVYSRYETLYKNKAVTQSEYEQFKFNYDQALSDFNMVSKKYKTQWETEINQYRNDLRDLQTQKIQLTEQEKLYTLKAPISGSIQNLTGLQMGAFVAANQKLGEISPDSALLAICYIKPSDIGLIKKGQNVRFQIDAFNYNQWGLLNGKVTDISDDIVILNQVPFFKVKCKLNLRYLQLKNGYKGQIKKGMTFSARFVVTRRSLFQLLYDKLDDWLNPNMPGLTQA